jgi:uncharacterized C2H2 Zn-finger protein
MRTTCPSCGYVLRSEIQKFGAFRFALYFDDGETVEHCPRCGHRLDGRALRQRDLARVHEERARRSAP